MDNQISAKLIITYISIFIISGSGITISSKIQYNMIGLGNNFTHIFFNNFLMFFSELLLLIPYYLINKNSDKNSKKNSNKIKWYQYAIPPVLDFFGSGLFSFGLLFLFAGVCQMIRGSALIITFIFSVLLLKNKHFLNHYFGIFLTILGIVFVGLAAFNRKKTAEEHQLHSPTLGLICTVVSQLFSGYQVIFEENLLKKYDCAPMKLAGMEGAFGTAYSVFVCLVFYFVKCASGSELSKQFCIGDENNVYRLENIFYAFRQMADNHNIILIILIECLGYFIYNFTGLGISKYSTAVNRCIIDTIRIIIVWGYFMLPFNDIKIREKFSFLQLSGFVFLLFGNLIYNDVLSYLKCNNNESNSSNDVGSRNNNNDEEDIRLIQN